MIYDSDHIYPWWIGLCVPKFINVCICILLAHLRHGNLLGGSLLPLGGHAHSMEVSYFVTSFVLCIYCRTLLPCWCSCFPHLMHLPSIPGGFLEICPELEDLCSLSCFCATGFPFFWFFLLLPQLFCLWSCGTKCTEAVESSWLRLL